MGQALIPPENVTLNPLAMNWSNVAQVQQHQHGPESL